MDANGADKLILLVQTNQVLYNKSVAGYKVKDALEKGDIWQIGVDITVNSERTTDLRCRFSFLVSRWQCDRAFTVSVGVRPIIFCDKTSVECNDYTYRQFKGHWEEIASK